MIGGWSTKANVTFLNRTDQAVELYWIGLDGAPQRWSSISPNSFANVDTYVGHLWSVKTPGGVELLRYVVK